MAQHTWFITGVSSGFGRQLTEQLLERGDRDQPPMDLVVTVCDEAAEECPYFPNARRQIHWGFPDPSTATGTEEERLAIFRHVCDLIAARLTAFVDGHQMSSLPTDRREAQGQQ